MIPAFDIRHGMDKLSAELGLLAKEQMPAAVRSMNRTITTVRAEGARGLGREYPGLKIGKIKRQMRFKRAVASDPSASITFSNKRFRLFGNWNVRQTRSGVRGGRLPFRLESGDGLEITSDMLRSAFIQRSRTHGTANVWRRAHKGRYPIEVILAPSLSSALVERGIGDALVRTARGRFAVVFMQEARFRLSKRD